MKKLIIAVAICAAITGGCSKNEEDSAKYNYRERGCFEPMDLDANHDGEVTKAEATLFYTEEFKWFDQDEDGVVAIQEIVANPEEKVLIDTNNDGVATMEEYVAYWSEHPCKCGKWT